MQDQYTGLAGTYYTDPETGQRLTSEEMAAKIARQEALQDKPKKAHKPAQTEELS